MGTKVLVNRLAGNYTTEFDSGSVNNVVINGDIVTITPMYSFENKWWWYAFASYKFGGRTPTFRIPKANYFQLISNIFRYGCYSTILNSDNWVDFGTPTIGSTYIEFTPSAPLPTGRLYFASMQGYTVGRTNLMISTWLSHPYASDTGSSNAGILAYSTQRISPMDGRLIPPQPYFAFKISKTSGNPKNKAIIASGNHSGETTGRYACEGAVNWLLGGTAEAEQLLDWFDFYVYPNLCPDGVYAGLFRSGTENMTLNYNRQWGIGSTLEGINIVEDAMLADTGGAIDAAIDFHSANSGNSNYNFGYAEDTAIGYYPSWQTIMKSLEGDTYNLIKSESENLITDFWFNSFSGTRAIIITAETQGRMDKSVVNFRSYGEKHMRAIHQCLLDGIFQYGP